MNVDDTIAEPETSSNVQVYEEQDVPTGIYSGFVGENASYFAQAYAPLNEVFNNDGAMKVVSDETEYTVVVEVRQAEGSEVGVMDVDCAVLEADQESLKECLVALDGMENNG